MTRPARPLLALLLVPLALAACGGGGGTAGAGSSTAASTGTPTPSAVIYVFGSPTASPVPSPTPKAASGAATTRAATSAMTASSAAVAAVTVSGTGKAGLKLRAAPNGKELAGLPEGTVLTPLGDAEQQAGGYTWLHVKTAKGVEGWVADKYVSPPPGGAAATATPAKSGG